MYAIITALVLAAQPELLPMPEVVAVPAQFIINVDSRTPYTLYINGNRIEAGQEYRTEPLDELICVEIEVRYVCGDEVKTRKVFIDLDPGYKHNFTITLHARPTLAWC